jgi:hypothetical protein
MALDTEDIVGVESLVLESPKGISRGDERVSLRLTPEERAFLDASVDEMGYPSKKALIFDSISHFRSSLDDGVRSAGLYGSLGVRAERLEEVVRLLRLDFQRFLRLLGGYQRSFQVFTVLHDCKISPKKKE